MERKLYFASLDDESLKQIARRAHCGSDEVPELSHTIGALTVSSIQDKVASPHIRALFDAPSIPQEVIDRALGFALDPDRPMAKNLQSSKRWGERRKRKEISGQGRGGSKGDTGGHPDEKMSETDGCRARTRPTVHVLCGSITYGAYSCRPFPSNHQATSMTRLRRQGVYGRVPLALPPERDRRPGHQPSLPASSSRGP